MTWNNTNYSQADMLSMQRDAMNRVMEMQRRAQQHISQSNRPLSQERSRVPVETPSPGQQNTAEARQPTPSQAPHIPTPPPPPPRQNSPPPGNPEGKGDHLLNLPFLPVNLLEKFNLDSERLILLGLGLVLLNEGGDRILLLALIYIFLN